MSKLRMAFVACLLAIALAAAGCASAEVDRSQLQGAWKLKAFGAPNGLREASPDVSTVMTLTADSKVEGNAGVNQFSGPYSAPGGNALTFGQMMSTKMAGPPAAMEQESEFFAILPKVKHFSVENGQLILESDGNDTLMVLTQTK